VNATTETSPSLAHVFAESFEELHFAGAAGKFLEGCASRDVRAQLLDRHIIATRGLAAHSRVLLPQHTFGFHLIIDFRHTPVEQAHIIGGGLARTFHYNLTKRDPGHVNLLTSEHLTRTREFYVNFAQAWIDTSGIERSHSSRRYLPMV
jgi:hypothetical protein